MKKTSLLSAALLAAALLFTACSNASGGDNEGSGSNLPKMDVSEYSDCTQSTQTFEAAANTNWAVKFEGDSSSFSRAADTTPPFTIVIDVEAAYSGSDFTFTSAKFTQTMNTKDCMDGDTYNYYKNLSPASKSMFNSYFMTSVGSSMQNQGFGTLIPSESSIDDNYIKLTYTLSNSYKQEFESAFKQGMQSSNKSLKTNPGKNKYIVNVSNQSYYMKKL